MRGTTTWKRLIPIMVGLDLNESTQKSTPSSLPMGHLLEEKPTCVESLPVEAWDRLDPAQTVLRRLDYME